MVRQDYPEDQTFTFRTIPFLSVTVYARTTFTLPDGSRPNPFPLTAIQVPVDRLPDEMPPSTTHVAAFIVAFQPANSRASQPVAVTYPNTLNTSPGTQVPLSTLDPVQGRMVNYGTGTVSADGTQIVPDLDRAHPGHRYGIVNFDWHGPPQPPRPVNPSPEGCPGVKPRRTSWGGAASGGDPIDLSSGIFIFSETDLAMNGLRGSMAIVRTYRSLSLQERCGPPICFQSPGPFGIGTNHNYAYGLTPNGGTLDLSIPSGNLLPLARQPDGTYKNSDIPWLLGAVV